MFASSLALLASAAVLGQGLERPPADALGSFDALASEDLRLRGDLVAAAVPATAAWSPAHAVLSNATLWLDGPAVAAVADAVLVTGLDAAVAGEDRVVQGAVVYADRHPDDPSRSLVVVAAHRVSDAP